VPDADGKIKGIAIPDLPLGIRSERLATAVDRFLAYGSPSATGRVCFPEHEVEYLNRALREFQQ
jgi:hypothetical protein